MGNLWLHAPRLKRNVKRCAAPDEPLPNAAILTMLKAMKARITVHGLFPTPARGSSVPSWKPGRTAFRRSSVWLAVALGAAVVMASCARKEESPAPSPPAPPAGVTNVSAPAVAPPTELVKLKGRWLRPDGGYILQIEEVDATGRMGVRYFNPRPINVARAEGRVENRVAKIFVELRDEGYPGSTYSLAHDAQNDRLYGVYYQAAMGQSFEVVFERAK
jgi:hypothetical protein